MISIAIPSKNEKFLQRTILDILEKATGDIEIFPILDGYEPPIEEIVNDPRVHYIRLEAKSCSQKRQGINKMVEICNGDYVMSVDAHCMFAPGFDEQLVKDQSQYNLVQVPRRHRLDAEKWDLQPQSDNRPPIDYEYIMFNPLLVNNEGLHGFKWDERTLKRWDIPIDDILTFQGSCWFMTKQWFKERGFMSLNYQGWGQEAEEISFETWKNGGRVVVNKNTWYAHLHKGKKYGRMYFMSKDENRKSYEYSYNLWMRENKEFFISLIEKFMPLPKWPNNWKEYIWKI